LPATPAPRREQARALRAQGLTIPKIAERLGVSQFTVKADLTGYVRPSRRDQPTRQPLRPLTPEQRAFGSGSLITSRLRSRISGQRLAAPSSRCAMADSVSPRRTR
jgi:hypothetical protein